MRNSVVKKYRKFVKSISSENEYEPRTYDSEGNLVSRQMKKTSTKFIMKYAKRLHRSVSHYARFDIINHLQKDLDLKLQSA